VFSTLVPFACFYAGLRSLPPAQAGILATTEPVVAVLSAAVILGETLHALQWLGAALVLCASLLATLQDQDAIRAMPERG
jgi:drug/metabolite transporter (DMT)-like permease